MEDEKIEYEDAYLYLDLKDVTEEDLVPVRRPGDIVKFVEEADIEYHENFNGGGEMFFFVEDGRGIRMFIFGETDELKQAILKWMDYGLDVLVILRPVPSGYIYILARAYPLAGLPKRQPLPENLV